jgi:hypothetical protein
MLNIISYIKESLGYDVYLARFLDCKLKKKVYHNYYGHTGEIYTRLGVHCRRYYNQMSGGEAKLYNVARQHTKSFHDIEIYIIATFATREEAKEYEDQCIDVDGDLNTNRNKKR